MLTQKIIIFMGTDTNTEVFSGKDCESEAAAFAQGLMIQAGVPVSRLPQDDVLDTFAREHRAIGSFSEPLFVPIDATYIISSDEGRTLFEEQVGRPPTQEEFETLQSDFADALSESSVWETLRETINALTG